MGKLIIGLLAVLGAMLLISRYFPGLWSNGVNIGGHVITFAIFIVIAVVYLAAKSGK